VTGANWERYYAMRENLDFCCHWSRTEDRSCTIGIPRDVRRRGLTGAYLDLVRKWEFLRFTHAEVER